MPASRYPALAFVSIAVVMLFAACSSGSNPPVGSAVNSSPVPGVSPSGTAVTVAVTVTIPSAASTSSGRRPRYVSPHTQSITMQLVSVNGAAVSGQSTTTIQTYNGAPNCAAKSSGLVCTATVPAIAGEDVFSINLFSSPNATGSVLASGSVASSVGGNNAQIGISNAVSLAIGGVIANVSVSVLPSSVQIGTPATMQVLINATDASGATIVAPGNFDQPVELTTNDSTNSVGFVVSPNAKPAASISVAAPSTPVQLVYDGSSNLIQGTFSVTASAGTMNGSATVQVNEPVTPTPSSGPTTSPSPGQPTALLYVLNAGANGSRLGGSVTEFATNASGNTAPFRTLQLSQSLYAVGMTVDKNGNVYVGYYDQPPMSTGGQLGMTVWSVDPGNEIDVYAPGASGNAQPSRRIMSETTVGTNLDPGLLFVDPTGRLLALAETNVNGQGQQSDSLVVYPSGASGAAVPSTAWNFNFNNNDAYINGYSFIGSPPGYLYGMTEDAAGNLYVGGGLISNGSATTLVSVAPSTFVTEPTGLSDPTRTIPADATTKLPTFPSGSIEGLVLDANGAVFVSQVTGTSPSIEVYAPGASSGTTDSPPLRSVTSSAMTVSDPTQPSLLPLAISASNLYVGVQAANSVLVFPSTANGSVTPSATIAGSATGISRPIAIAVGPVGTSTSAARRRVVRIRP